MKHKWFSGFDWEGLLKRTMNTPIKPVIEHPEDTANFDEYPEEDEHVPPCAWDPVDF